MLQFCGRGWLSLYSCMLFITLYSCHTCTINCIFLQSLLESVLRLCRIPVIFKRYIFFFMQRNYSWIKVVWYPKMGQKGCLNMVKKDQLCGIALKKRNWILKVMTQNGSYGNQPQPPEVMFFTALAPTLPAFSQNKIWLSSKQTRKFLFCSVQWT